MFVSVSQDGRIAAPVVEIEIGLAPCSDHGPTEATDTDRAHRCLECDAYARLSRGSGAGLAAVTPDLETSAGRHGGAADD